MASAVEAGWLIEMEKDSEVDGVKRKEAYKIVRA